MSASLYLYSASTTKNLSENFTHIRELASN
uniref:Uncharacterized protein n=1 Tax=Rhizophora mucronata TaxID=61149 RepID=A0A2P2NZR5_RHIMU